MKIYKTKKAYIVATVFGLSLIIIIPSVSFAQSVYDKQDGLLKSSVQIALFKPQLSQNQAHFGVIVGIDGSTFALNSVADNATSAYVVNTDANTIFKKDGVADTVSNLAVGQRVMVRGLTSTDTISAQSVNMITHEPTLNGLKHVFKEQK